MPRTSIYKRTSLDPNDPRDPLPYPDWGATFCNVLADCGNVRQAALIAGVSYETVMRHRRGDTRLSLGNPTLRGPCPAFAADMDASMDQAVDLLRHEAWKRALKGSDRLLIFLLKAHDPDLYVPVQQQDVDISHHLGPSIEDLREKLMRRLLPDEPGAEFSPTDESVIDVESREVLDGE